MGKPDFKVTSSKKRNSDVQQLVFEGDLGIFNAEKIQKKLKRISLKAPNIQLVLKNVEGMDLTTIQILLSLKKSIEAKSANSEILAEIPDEKMDLLRQTGLDKLIK